jgi:hypothetical protein
MEEPHATHKAVPYGWVLVVQRLIDVWVARRYALRAAASELERLQCAARPLDRLSAPH